MKQYQYVAGFLFNSTNTGVVLIEKHRPDWQKGKLNGIGGAIEDGERPIDAMRREFLQETGLDITDWKLFAILEGTTSDKSLTRVFFYLARRHTNFLAWARSQTDEAPGVYNLASLPHNILPDLRWLIPMALTARKKHAPIYTVREVAESESDNVIAIGGVQ